MWIFLTPKKLYFSNMSQRVRRNSALKILAQACVCLLGLSSCNKDILSVHTEYITIESLSSYYVNTPDPKLNNPPFGQKLVVEWRLPGDYPFTQVKETKACEDGKADFTGSARDQEFRGLALNIIIRFRDRTQENILVSLKRRSGRYVFSLNDNRFCEHGQIITYKVQLLDEESLVEEWKHQLWTELILFEEPSQEGALIEGSEDASENPFDFRARDDTLLEEKYEEMQFLP